jgi:DNA polymerase-4
VNEVRPVVFHVDLDAFYASVEVLDDPSLAGRPVIVGALPGHRGVVSACSYEARKFGVHSAMPISQAHRRCPQAAFLPVRMERYLEVSRGVMAILERFTPHLQQISVDEAFLDMSGTERLFGPALATGARLKEEVRREAGLAITVGIGPNKFVAKLATNSAKPDGLREVTPGQLDAFLESLALKDLWGVGAKTLERLSELAIGTVAELRSLPEPELAGLLGKGVAAFLCRASRGVDPGIFSEEPQSRSLSAETTFETDRKDRTSVERALLELCHQVAFRMLDEGWRSKTAVLKLRFHDFTTTTARKTIGHWITSTEELFAVVRALLAARWDGGTPVRLVGAGCANLERAGELGQLQLFADGMERRRKVEEAVLALRRRMGDATVTKASLLDEQAHKGAPRPRR